MRVASIDIGTNTILMLIADLAENGTLTVLSDEQRIARVGKGVDKTGAIAWEAFSRSESILEEYLATARSMRVDVIRATGTSALRDAHNREDYLNYMQQRLDLDIEILDGADEALWTYGGAISGFTERKGRFAVLDIGGGSTELTSGEGFRIIERKSLDIGCVRLTEKFLPHSPPREQELLALIDHVDHAVRQFPHFDVHDTVFVGVAGTVTTLAAVELGLESYDRNAVAGFRLSRETIERRYRQFSALSKEELQHALRIDPGRADIILVGVVILLRFMTARGLPDVTVSERGLRYGIALREWERELERSTMS
ncbi:MAG: Ppx/GppA family phosphatase [Bacteroidia bacterium]|nr:Ppx/GppA family phosphatase [Bacteroidia bacterium]